MFENFLSCTHLADTCTWRYELHSKSTLVYVFERDRKGRERWRERGNSGQGLVFHRCTNEPRYILTGNSSIVLPFASVNKSHTATDIERHMYIQSETHAHRDDRTYTVTDPQASTHTRFFVHHTPIHLEFMLN